MTSTSPEDLTQQPGPARVVRYLTVGGALVDVLQREVLDYPTNGCEFSWECLGCGERNRITYGPPTLEQRALGLDAGRYAQDHAGVCRAVPASIEAAAPPSAGHARLAEELARARAESRQVTTAVSALAATIAEVAGLPLQDLLRDLFGDLGLDVREGLAELAERLPAQPELELVAEPTGPVGVGEPKTRRGRWAWLRGGGRR